MIPPSKLSPFTMLLHLLLLLLISTSPSTSQDLSPSQSKTLLRLQRLLEFPSALSSLSSSSSFCYLPPSPSFSLSCSSGRLTSLSISGNNTSSFTLSSSFSSDSLFTTLTRFPSLTSLSLVSLGLWGPLPSKLHRLSNLKLLNLSSNHFSGSIPPQLSTMTSLQALILSHNSLNGTLPDLHPLSSITDLDLSNNLLGPDLPTSFSSNLVSLILSKNHFHASIPLQLQSLDKLQKLDLSSNLITGKIPTFLFSLPAIQYLDLSSNGLAGAFPVSLSCGAALGYVDVSNNLLTGAMPLCLRSNSSNLFVLNSGNCLTGVNPKNQHSGSYCNQGALAAILPPVEKNNTESKNNHLGLILGIVGGIIGGGMVIGLLLFVALRKIKPKSFDKNLLPKSSPGLPTIQVSPRTPAETRHMSQAVRIGTIGLMPYRVFSLEELEEATNDFDPGHLIEESPQGKFYKGWHRDGSTIMIRCIKLKQKYSAQSLVQFTDTLSKLRHRHLVSILGHCIVSGQDNAGMTIFLVTEYVSNGTLRSHLTEWRKREMLKWPQRIAAVIGIARGIQFLHTVTVPGIFGNNLTIENILLDETLTAKISNYNLPALPKNKNNKIGSESPFGGTSEGSEFGSVEHGEKEDVYQLGLILLEIIVGKPTESRSELDTLKLQLQRSLSENPAKLKGMTDPTIRGTFAHDSLQTAVEVTLNCLANEPKERPSIDDVLWNLQYTVQVQDGWASSENLSTQS
ncbi:Non-specific serine/threonine protein kinase protein [Dioscorea alata]|uniref:Non-specific serine/threonine protein kinase protein n=1 Tax=Dioscorea alata TaxID=55571 RepID=A0ACB7UAV8_DIOAL|nr:Non-specific serine/threonine protein kinase protein [Dioscorea alata]